jgi:hypothetical protein
MLFDTRAAVKGSRGGLAPIRKVGAGCVAQAASGAIARNRQMGGVEERWRSMWSLKSFFLLLLFCYNNFESNFNFFNQIFLNKI